MTPPDNWKILGPSPVIPPFSPSGLQLPIQAGFKRAVFLASSILDKMSKIDLGRIGFWIGTRRKAAVPQFFGIFDTEFSPANGFESVNLYLFQFQRTARGVYGSGDGVP